jgi:O-antigen/teichoic acid export membrane protein
VARSSFARSTALLAGSALAGQGLLVAASPALSRIYSPRDIGALAVYSAALAVLLTLVTLRFEAAIPLAADDVTAVSLLVLALLAVGAFSVLVGLGVVVAGDDALRLTNAESLHRYVWLLPLGLAGAGLYRALSGWAVRALAFGRLAWTTVTQASLQVVLQIGVGLAVAGPLGLVLGSIGGNAGGSGNLLRLVWSSQHAVLRRVSPATLRAAARRYRKFALVSAPASTLSGISLFAAPILLAGFYGAHVAGWYALTQRVVGLPGGTIGSAVANVFYGRAARLHREEPGALRGLFLRMASRLAVFGLVPFGALALFGPWLFAHVFGGEWREAGVYARVLAPMFFVQFVASPGAQTIFVFERQELQWLLVAARLVLGLGVLVAAHVLGWSALAAVGAYGGGLALTHALTLWLSGGLAVRGALADPAVTDYPPAP